MKKSIIFWALLVISLCGFARDINLPGNFYQFNVGYPSGWTITWFQDPTPDACAEVVDISGEKFLRVIDASIRNSQLIPAIAGEELTLQLRARGSGTLNVGYYIYQNGEWLGSKYKEVELMPNFTDHEIKLFVNNGVSRSNKTDSIRVIFYPSRGSSLEVYSISGQLNAVEVNPSASVHKNVKDFGAVGDGVTDDSDAINRAIEYAASLGNKVYIPAGNYAIAKTINIEGVYGLSIFGDNLLTSRLIWKGTAGGTVVDIAGSGHVMMKDLCIYGKEKSDDTNTAGKLVYIHSTPGKGAMIFRFSNMSFTYGEHGFYYGTESDVCAADTVFDFVRFNSLDVAFKVTHIQGVDFVFNYLFSCHTKKVLVFDQGGNLKVNTAQVTGCERFLEINGGGCNSGTFLLDNVRVELPSLPNYSMRGQLVKATPTTGQVLVKFNNYDDAQWDWYKRKEPIPLCEVGERAFVEFNNSIFNSLVATVNGGTYPARLIIKNSTFATQAPMSLNMSEMITANTNGYYKLIDNCDQEMNLLSNDTKWQ